MNSKVRKIVMASLVAALVCVATMIIKIPSPLNGYLNLGDCIVLLAGWMMSPMYAFFAAGIGAGLADVFSGYAVYAPVTFVIKGMMALISFFGFKIIHKKLGVLKAQIISGITAEVVMILGYFVFEGFMYGFGASAVNIPANGIQGIAGLIIGILLTQIFQRNKIILN